MTKNCDKMHQCKVSNRYFNSNKIFVSCYQNSGDYRCDHISLLRHIVHQVPKVTLTAVKTSGHLSASMYTYLLLLLVFLERRISRTSLFTGSYIHQHNKTYTKSYNRLKDKVLKIYVEVNQTLYFKKGGREREREGGRGEGGRVWLDLDCIHNVVRVTFLLAFVQGLIAKKTPRTRVSCDENNEYA